jgi:CDP-diacylglycerol---glycerol-3-phosphate 3-phosphatidyltransferase
VIQLTFANILTLSRLFLAPIFLVFALTETAESITIAIVIFGIAAFTDWLDGVLARSYEEVTEQGAFLDPLADKVLTTMAFVAFYIVDIMPLWMLIVIVARDFGTTVLRSIADQKGKRIITSWNAKLKTFLQMLFIVYALVLMWLTFNADDPTIRTNATQLLRGDVTWFIIFGITTLTVLTMIEYLIHYRDLFRRQRD